MSRYVLRVSRFQVLMFVVKNIQDLAKVYVILYNKMGVQSYAGQYVYI